MKIPSESYQTIYDQYSEAIAWMDTIGVNLGKGRTSHYDKVLGYWKDNYDTAPNEEAKTNLPDFISSIFEIHEFITVHESLKIIHPKKLSSIAIKLQKAVNGPIKSSDESAKSTAARNFLFEAIVAAKAHNPAKGASTILDARSDTGVYFHDKKIWIECKRVTSLEGIEKNVRKACNQLKNVFAKNIGSSHRGLVALDVSKILNNGDGLLVRENDAELYKTVSNITESFIKDHSEIWQRIFSEKHQKIIGLILRTSYMAISEERNLFVHVADYGVNPKNGISESNSALQRSLVEALNS